MDDQCTAQKIVNLIGQYEHFEAIPNDDLLKFVMAIMISIEEGMLLSGNMPLDSVTLNQGSSASDVNGSSIKLKNAWFNMEKFFEVIASSAFTLTSVASVPWLAPFGFLLLYRQIRGLMEIKLHEQDAFVLLCLWRCRKNDMTVTESSAYSQYIRLTSGTNLTTVSFLEFNRSLETLCSLGCIEAAGEDSWRIVERIQLQ